MKHWFLFGLVSGILISIVGGGAIFLFWHNTKLIAFGVHIQGIDIGGMKVTDARRTLENKLVLPSFVTVAITHKGQVIQRVRLNDLGLKPNFDEALKNALQIGRNKSLKANLTEFLIAWQGGFHLPMVYDWDEESGRQILNRIAKSLNCHPRRAIVEWRKGNVHIIPSRKGFKVAVDETLSKWAEKLKQGQWENLPLIATDIEPEVTNEDVASIDGVIGQATTHFRTSERNRSHNIRLAASRLDHVLVRPKETLSFNELVGPRTPHRGFRVARVLAQGQFREDFGGGVCQVAGTLYLAALQAGMKVIQRHRHSRPIAYLPPGLDATVDFGSLDLKLRNPFDTPIYLRTFVKGGKLTVLILGKREKGVTYKIFRAVEKFGNNEVKQIPNQNLMPGELKVVDKGSSGYRVVVWRLRIESGIVTKRERISNDTYPPRPKIVQVGTVKKDEQSENATQVSEQPNRVHEVNQTQLKTPQDEVQILP